MEENKILIDYPCLQELASLRKGYSAQTSLSLEEILDELQKNPHPDLTAFITDVAHHCLVLFENKNETACSLLKRINVSEQTINCIIDDKTLIKAIEDLASTKTFQLDKNKVFQALHTFLTLRTMTHLLIDVKGYKTRTKTSKGRTTTRPITYFLTTTENIFLKIKRYPKTKSKNYLIEALLDLTKKEKVEVEMVNRTMTLMRAQNLDLTEAFVWEQLIDFTAQGASLQESKKLLVAMFDIKIMPNNIKILFGDTPYYSSSRKALISLYPLIKLINPNNSVYIDEDSFYKDPENKYESYTTFDDYKKDKMADFLTI